MTVLGMQITFPLNTVVIVNGDRKNCAVVVGYCDDGWVKLRQGDSLLERRPQMLERRPPRK